MVWAGQSVTSAAARWSKGNSRSPVRGGRSYCCSTRWRRFKTAFGAAETRLWPTSPNTPTSCRSSKSAKSSSEPPVDDIVDAGYTAVVKVVGNRIAETPAEYLAQLRRLCKRLDQWNPYPRPRGQVFKFRTWEDLEKWRQNQTNPRLR